MWMKNNKGKRKSARWIATLACIALVFQASAATIVLHHQMIDARDYTLTVSSAHGSPSPVVGTNLYAWGTSVTCSVPSTVIEQGILWRNIGWTGTGSIPTPGTTNTTGEIELTELVSSISWKWETDFAITNVTAQQRPGTKLVDITYDIISDVTNAVPISLQIKNGDVVVSSSSSTGDVRSSVLPGVGKSIVWNAGAEWNGTFSEDLLFTVGLVTGTSSLSAWATGGQANWFSQSAVTYDGEDALRSGAIMNNQESWLQTTVTGPGTISFWWKVSSESSFDWLEFYSNNVRLHRISGNVNWINQSYLIPSGAQTLKWRYVKDGSANAGSDCGWVDCVAWNSDVWDYEDSIVASIDTRDYTLTVSSDYGTPSPSIGVHFYPWGSVINTAVDTQSIEDGVLWNYIGWAGTGSVPATGSMNTTSEIELTELVSSITWNWETDFAITNVTAQQRPGTKLVDITYDLVSGVTNAVPISLKIKNGTSNVTSTASTGDVGTVVLPGAGKHIVWNMETNWNTNSAPLTYSVMHTTKTNLFAAVVAPSDSRNYSLTVNSAHGSPSPAIGTHAYLWGSTIEASVGKWVIQGNVTYTCTGWSGVGVSPTSGVETNTGVITITEPVSSITWNWKSTQTYNIKGDNTVEITGYAGPGGVVFIPEEIEGRPVTSIANGAYSQNSTITHLTVPASVTHVGIRAFSECASLEGLYFLGHAPIAGADVLTDSPLVTVYYYPNSTGWWGGKFGGKPAVLLPYEYLMQDGVVTITLYVGNETSIQIPSLINGLPVTRLEGWSFYGLKNAISVTVPATVTSIGDSAFWTSVSLSVIYFSGDAPALGSSVFRDINATVYYPSGTTGWGATYGGLPTALWVPSLFLSVYNGTGGGTYTNQQQVTITANAASTGKTFDRWTGATQYVGSVTSSTTVVTMPAQNISVTASYKDILYSLTVEQGSGGGTAYTYQQQVEIEAESPPNGYVFYRWTGATQYVSSVSSSVAVVTMPAQDISLSATYRDVNAYVLTISGGTGGGSYTVGERVEISANAPPPGKIFDRWTGATQYVDNVTASTTGLMMPALNITVIATYKDILYSLIVTGGSGGGTTYTNGQRVTISANTPAAGKVFDRWTGDTQYVDDSTSSTTTVTMPTAMVSLIAEYRVILYTLTASSSGRGRIEPSGEIQVAHGAEQIFTAVPDGGFRIKHWLVGSDIVGEGQDELSIVAGSDTTVSVVFEAGVALSPWLVFEGRSQLQRLDEFGGKRGEPVVLKEARSTLLVVNRDRLGETNAVLIAWGKGDPQSILVAVSLDDSYPVSSRIDKTGLPAAERNLWAVSVRSDSGKSLLLGTFDGAYRYDKDGVLNRVQQRASLNGAGFSPDDPSNSTELLRLNQKAGDALITTDGDFPGMAAVLRAQIKKLPPDVSAETLSGLLQQAAGGE